MRASDTVSEASPGSTTAQSGVPTQVVQQVQATQQVWMAQAVVGVRTRSGSCICLLQPVLQEHEITVF